MTQTNTNAIPMTKPFSSNPKLADWVPTPEQRQTIEEARSLMGLRPYGTADSANDFLVNAIDVHACLFPDLLEDVEGFVEDLDFALERMHRNGHLQGHLSDA
jgi:hypothetical protein